MVGVSNVQKLDNTTLARKVFSDCLNVNISVDQIQNCYSKKINKPSTSGNNITGSASQEVLCVRFFADSSKKLIMQKKKSNSNRLLASTLGANYGNGSIYINDSLTSDTKKLYNAAKKVKIDKKYKYLWIRNATILMRKREGDRVVVVRSFGDLENIV